MDVDIMVCNMRIKIDHSPNKYIRCYPMHCPRCGETLGVHGTYTRNVEFLDKLISDVDINYKNLEKGVIKLPVNRSLYLNELLKNVKGTEIVANKDYKDIINELDKDSIDDEETLPKSLERCIKTISKSWL